MTVLWCCMVGVSVLFGALGGTLDTVSAAALSGAASAVTLCLSMAGVICLWTGVMEVMERSGLAGKLARLFPPCSAVFCPGPAGTRRPFPPSPPTSRRTFWAWGTPQRPWG